MTGKLQPESNGAPIVSHDGMYDDLQNLLDNWSARGIDPELVLSRFHCMAVTAMRSAGITFEQMVGLVAIAYGFGPKNKQRAQRA